MNIIQIDLRFFNYYLEEFRAPSSSTIKFWVAHKPDKVAVIVFIPSLVQFISIIGTMRHGLN